MKRYLIMLYVRPEGSPDSFAPAMIAVDAATDEATALAVVTAVAEERGWESKSAHIVRREDIT